MLNLLFVCLSILPDSQNADSVGNTAVLAQQKHFYCTPFLKLRNPPDRQNESCHLLKYQFREPEVVTVIQCTSLLCLKSLLSNHLRRTAQINDSKYANCIFSKTSLLHRRHPYIITVTLMQKMKWVIVKKKATLPTR